MNRNTYIKQTAKNLSCSRSKKNEIIRQLNSDIESALESGENWEAIRNRLGTPTQIAEEINENLTERSGADHRKRNQILILIFGITAIAIVSILLTVWGQKRNEPSAHNQNTISSHQTQEKESLSREDAQTLSIDAIERFNNGDYQSLLDLSNDKLKASLSIKTLKQVREQIMPDAGQFQKVGKSSTVRIDEETASYVTVQTHIQYTNQTVTFTLSWNNQKELCGFYLK